MSKKQATTADKADSGGLMDKFRHFANYLELSRLELRKVTWPSAKETRVTSLAVLVFVVVMSIFLGLVDLGFSKLISFTLQ